MINVQVAFSSLWQLARHWKHGDTAKLELSCEAGSLHMQMTAKLDHADSLHFPQSFTPKKKYPSQLRGQERRKQEALSNALQNKKSK